MSAHRALITGASGQLGSDLQEVLGQRGWQLDALTHADLDVTDDRAVGDAFEASHPEVVFNCAAFHNVDACEAEEDMAAAVNFRAVKRLAQHAHQANAALVHLSTNYVFDGRRADGGYAESDLPAPRSVYAVSKLAGEHAALAYCERALVVRTAGLYGLHGSRSKGGNFVTRVLTRAREQGELRMVADQRLNPTFTADLAVGLVAALEAGLHGHAHLTSSGACSWHEFTEAILELAGLEVPVEAVSTTTPPGGADRPLNGVLVSEAAPAAGLDALRHWREALADYMGRAGHTRGECREIS
ncbi:MAG TPA: dTDP-4-dehydrorhamnose reductase [Thermoleophilaceae bacterium]|nr:dTDP-4-dehydrorhamnose reductase [Thermoleophilaceae bacterium]